MAKMDPQTETPKVNRISKNRICANCLPEQTLL